MNELRQLQHELSIAKLQGRLNLVLIYKRAIKKLEKKLETHL